MKTYIKRMAVLTGFLSFFAGELLAQNIDEVLRDPSNNYFTIKQKAEAYFQQYGLEHTGYKEYKRWEFLVKNNIAKDGTLPDFVVNNQRAFDLVKADKNRIDGSLAGISNWVPIGQPNPTIEAGDAQNGTGSIRSIDFVGNDIWAGTPGGGIWFGDYVSGNNFNWTAKTDGIPNLAVQDVEIAATNTSIVYALTGSVGNASGYRSTGVIKSIDGGTTWAITGLNFPESGAVKGYKLKCSSTSSSKVWACTTSGLYLTTDGGTSWHLVTYSTTVGGVQSDLISASFDIEYQPGSTTVMYATASNYFYKSTDGGATFLRVDRVPAGLPTSGNRIEIAVTAANSAYIYLLYSNGTSFQGLYRSTNSGSTFSLRSSSPNILGSQSWRNTPIAVSPTNAEDLYVGGLDIFKSITGGSTWTQITDWTSTSTSNFSHADIFDLSCNSVYLYAATDGGMYRMTRSTDTWTSIHKSMQISQPYRLAVDPSAAAGFVTMGNQDNGTYRNTGATYLSIGGGDGMETVIKPSNTNVIYVSSQNGSFSRSDDGGSTRASIFNSTIANATCGCTDAGNWTTPIVIRPGNDTHVYIGYNNIYYNTNSGIGSGSWSFINTGFSNGIESLEFAPSNSSILYATQGSSVKRFNLAGAVWSATTITGNLPALSNITELAVDPNNSSHVVLSVGGYTATQKVYETFNASAASPTWSSIVRNLPNVPVNCIVMNSDAANSIYLGTDIGVFVTNDNRVNWIMYSNGLPTTRVYDLEINTAVGTDKIFAATFGRGVFKADTYTGCSVSAILAGSVNGLEYNEVSSSITSTQYIWGGLGTSVGYNSGGSIVLNPGFEVKSSSKFEAYIQGCTGAGSPPRQLKIINKRNTDPLPDGINPQGEIKGQLPPLIKSDNGNKPTDDNDVNKPAHRNNKI